MTAIQLRPTSKGSVTLDENTLEPIIDTNFLNTENDQQAAIANLKTMIGLGQSKHMRSIIDFENAIGSEANSLSIGNDKNIQLEDAQDGKCEALQIFPLNGKDAGTAIGCRMKQGKLFRKNKFRLIRNGEMIDENLQVESLRILKKDVTFTSLNQFKSRKCFLVNVVPSGSNCGMLLLNEHGQGIVAEVGDEIECYTEVEVERV